MDNQVYTYALIKSFYDTGEDCIDCFVPFIVQALSDNMVRPLSDIQNSVNEKTGIAIPQYTLKTILKRSKRRGYVTGLGHGKYKITEDGLCFFNSLDTQDTVQRKLNSLSNHFSLFLSSRLNRTVDASEAFSLLRSFIESNLSLALDCINPSIDHPSPSTSISHTGAEKHIANYIEDIRLNSLEHYHTLTEIILGCTLSIALFCPDISSLNEKFKGTTVFLDSNFVFNVLGFHYNQFADPAKELFQMLKKYGFKIKIFNITVDEICNVINKFPVFQNIYSSNIRVASIYSQLKAKGWTSKDSQNFILSIEDKLNELGIQIETLEDVDINFYTPSDHQLLSILEQYKPGQLRAGKNHDLISIEEVKKRRHHSVRNVQNAKVFFLTSDLKLAKFNFEQFGHKISSTICEVIPDFLLADFLWLQNPQSSPEMPLKLLISAHSRHLFVQRGVWERFVAVLRELKDNSCISDDKVAALLYHGRVEDLLRDIDESKCEIITPNFVMNEIEKAVVDIDEKITIKLKEKETEVQNLFEKKLSKQQEQRNEQWLSRVTTIKSNLRKSAQKKASWTAFFLATLISLVILGFVGALFCFGFKKYSKDQVFPYLIVTISIVSLILGSSGIIGVWRDLYKLKAAFSERFYTKKLKEAGLQIID